MGEYEKLLVGCAIVTLIIVLLLLCAWKYWHGEWLRSIAGNTFATDEEMKSPYQKRMGRRVALVNLALAVVLAGWLGLLVVDQVRNSLASGQVWPFVMLLLWGIGSGIYVLGGSRRDSKALAEGAASTGSGLSSDYEFSTRQVAILVIIMLAVVVLEIVMNFLDRGF